MANRISSARKRLLLSVALVLGASPTFATPIYHLQSIIPVPSIAANAAGAFSFDISFFDGNTQLDYVADRSNFAIDVFSAASNSFVTRIDGTGPNAFVGSVASPDTGPDGVLVTNVPGQHYVYGADGNSTVKVFDLATIGNPPVPGSPIVTGASSQGRADELAVDPKDKILIVANDHGTPSPFVSLINTTTNAVLQKIPFDGTLGSPNATNGIEQPVWNPSTGKFYISIPQIGPAGDPGGIAVVDPITHAVSFYDLATFGIAACGPTGLALGVGNQMMIGCANGGSILFDPTANAGAGKVITTFTQANGIDELAYDPTNHLFFLAGGNNTLGPFLSVIDGLTGTFLENVPTRVGAHSVSVDPVSNEVFVPYRPTTAIAGCSTGCVAVFAAPEPPTLPLMAGGLLGVLGFRWFRRRAASVT